MEKLTPEAEELFSSSFKLKQILSPVLPPDAVQYILELIARDGAHSRFLELTKEQD